MLELDYTYFVQTNLTKKDIFLYSTLALLIFAIIASTVYAYLETLQSLNNLAKPVDTLANLIPNSYPVATSYTEDNATVVIPNENNSTDTSANSTTNSTENSTNNTNNNSNNPAPEPPPEPIPEPEPPPPPPPPPETPSAVVAFYADNQSDSDAEDTTHQNVVNYILNSGANPVFHAGDLMEDGTEDSLNRFNAVTSVLRSARTFYAALGNNDRVYGDPSTPSPLFLNNFVFPNNEQWYSVNYGNLHMIILDSAFSASNPAQLNFLASDLQSYDSQSRITGVMFHHPAFEGTISSYLINYGADFVIMGHNHAYQHTNSNGIHYFITNGQPSLGYFIAQIYADSATITAYNQYNGVVEVATFGER